MNTSFYGVSQITITEPDSSGGHSWSKCIITHLVGGKDKDGEYIEVEVKTEIACHHVGLVAATVKVPS